MRVSLTFLHAVNSEYTNYLKVVITNTNLYGNVFCRFLCKCECESVRVVMNECISDCVC